ncbi:MAG TPA: cytochrome c [Bacteroidia bacterium]|nr:cytochrome c [Bacteroidia bacterium]
MNEKDSHLIQKQANAIVYLTILVLVLLLVVVIFSFNVKTAAPPDKEPLVFCGNALVVPANRQPDVYTEEVSQGRTLFKQNCAVCHSITDIKITGPGLKGVTDRVPKPTDEWLTAYILNNEKVRLSGDAYANKIYAENDSVPMTVFDSVLTQQQVKNIVTYIASGNARMY